MYLSVNVVCDDKNKNVTCNPVYFYTDVYLYP